MMLSNDSIAEFRSNLNDNGKAATAKRIIKDTMKNHFTVNLDFTKLQRFMILRFITTSHLKFPRCHTIFLY